MISISSKNLQNANLVFGDIASDKSLSHRSVIFAFLCDGECKVDNFLIAEDTLASFAIAKKLGAQITTLSHQGHLSIQTPVTLNSNLTLECKNSGTSIRLFAGLLAGKKGVYKFTGDESLSKRPMQRIIAPLSLMGARFDGNFAPFKLYGNTQLNGIEYLSPIASAQVKSAFILSALQARGESFFKEPFLSRDHTERFLSFLDAPLSYKEEGLCISPLKRRLKSYSITIPNDPSSVIFFIVAVLISKNVSATFKNVLLNPTRIYALEILKKMGAKLSYKVSQSTFEEIGEVNVSSSSLFGVNIDQKIAWLIDEIPVLCIAMACAKGVSKISNAEELRYKESDRIASVVSNLNQLGIEATELEDGIIIKGGEFVCGEVSSFGDHRIAMSFALTGIKVPMILHGEECVNVSFPNFFDILDQFINKE